MSKRNKRQVTEARWERKAVQGRVDEGKFQFQPQPIKPLNAKQKLLLQMLSTKPIVVVVGSAGTGKTFITMGTIADAYCEHKIDKIALSRPYCGMGKSMGFFPGDIRQKYEPYLLPLIDVLVKRVGRGAYDTGLHNGNIELVPLETLRGRSFEGAACILDEAQNATPEELFSVITRQGRGSQLVIMGDPAQKDLKGRSGLEWLLEAVKATPNLRELVGVVEFTSDDIVRGDVCKAFVKLVEKDGIKN